jgi:methionine-rich copper-binding protein CopC
VSPSAARLVVTGGATLLLLVMWSAPAFGHAEFRTSEPAAGATIEAPPDRVVARFTEPPDDASKLVVVDPCGDRADRGPTQTFDTQLGVETSSRFAGVYEVQYSVLSDLDGHPERGSFTFRVAEGEECTEVAAGEDPVAESSLFDLPVGGFIAGIACAILIGGAAGYVYVSTGRS